MWRGLGDEQMVEVIDGEGTGRWRRGEWNKGYVHEEEACCWVADHPSRLCAVFPVCMWPHCGSLGQRQSSWYDNENENSSGQQSEVVSNPASEIRPRHYRILINYIIISIDMANVLTF